MRFLQMAIMIVLLMSIGSSAYSQEGPQELGPPPPQDPINQLRLTPEQRQKIRSIREQNKGERQAINQRLREANIALEQALDADNPNEAEIEQRLREHASAHSAQTRMRVITELSIRRVLTPDQIAVWRVLRQQNAQRPLRNNPRIQNPDTLRPNQRNGLAPAFPRRNAVPKNPR